MGESPCRARWWAGGRASFSGPRHASSGRDADRDGTCSGCASAATSSRPVKTRRGSMVQSIPDPRNAARDAACLGHIYLLFAAPSRGASCAITRVYAQPQGLLSTCPAAPLALAASPGPPARISASIRASGPSPYIAICPDRLGSPGIHDPPTSNIPGMTCWNRLQYWPVPSHPPFFSFSHLPFFHSSFSSLIFLSQAQSLAF